MKLHELFMLNRQGYVYVLYLNLIHRHLRKDGFQLLWEL